MRTQKKMESITYQTPTTPETSQDEPIVEAKPKSINHPALVVIEESILDADSFAKAQRVVNGRTVVNINDYLAAKGA
jgi:hypothetical protein